MIQAPALIVVAALLLPYRCLGFLSPLHRPRRNAASLVVIQKKGHPLPPTPSRHHVLTNVADDDQTQEIGIGIDLGTTFSAVAYLQDGKNTTMIPIPDNGSTMPSLVSLQKDDAAIVGKAAAAADGEPYCNVKRIIGTGGKLPAEVRKVVPHLQPSAGAGKTFRKKDSLNNQLFDAQHHPTQLVSTLDPAERLAPEVISSHVLQTLKAAAEAHTHQTVGRAVIGVPAYFHDEQRAATLRAAEMAGLTKVKLLREPEAAALAYGMGKQQQQAATADGVSLDDELVLVFDLGGGTFDVSMLLVGGGLTEIISTSGNARLGGSDFDARVATHFQKLLSKHDTSPATTTTDRQPWSESSLAAVLRAAEAVRIHLSNNRKVSLALPLAPEAWIQMQSPKDVMILQSAGAEPLSEAGISNSTHVLCSLSRRTVEILCKEELQALLRPVREVAIMSGALLPGDTSPTLVEAAMDMEEAANQEDLVFDDFYQADGSATTNDDDDSMREELLLNIQQQDVKAAKKAQQRGRKKARNVAKQERKYRQEKRKIRADPSGRVKVRDGIAGRPISRVVLVGGATRMPAVGRLVAALTGTVPQKTVNPDEAVALGCAVHVGVLDGAEDMGTVLNPMQAAILRAVAEQQQGIADDEDFDNDDFF